MICLTSFCMLKKRIIGDIRRKLSLTKLTSQTTITLLTAGTSEEYLSPHHMSAKKIQRCGGSFRRPTKRKSTLSRKWQSHAIGSTVSPSVWGCPVLVSVPICTLVPVLINQICVNTSIRFTVY